MKQNKKVNTGKTGSGGKIKGLHGSKEKKPNNGFNVYWIYALIAIIFFGIQFFNWGTGAVEITWQKFEKEMLGKHEVQEIVTHICCFDAHTQPFCLWCCFYRGGPRQRRGADATYREELPAGNAGFRPRYQCLCKRSQI